jgi:hypothetical protein
LFEAAWYLAASGHIPNVWTLLLHCSDRSEIAKELNYFQRWQFWQGVRMFGANCTRLSLVLVLSVFAIPRAMADPQIIAGIEIDYPAAFERLKPETEEGRQRRVLNRYGLVNSAEVHKASIPLGMRLTGASGEVEIAKYELKTKGLLDLDLVARHTMEDWEQPGITGINIVNQLISVARVTGHEGRRLSLEGVAGKIGWHLYSEGLLIHDHGNNNLWHISVVLARRFFARLLVERDRSYPKSVLDTVRVIENPTTPL